MIPLGTTITENSVIIIMDSAPVTVAKSHENFDVIVERLLAKEYDDLMDLINPVNKISTTTLTGVGVEVYAGQAYYNGEVMDGELADKLVDEVRDGRPMPGFAAFVEKLMQNPSQSAIRELYLFMEKAAMPITPDGDFLAYKMVRRDFTDCHSGKMDNSPGQIVSMPRHKVDDDRRNCCSQGLHFCSYNYLNAGAIRGEKVVMVKVNPADVVAIPYDYDNAKGRTWRYEVVKEITRDLSQCIYRNYAYEEDEYDEEDYDEDEYEDDDED